MDIRKNAPKRQSTKALNMKKRQQVAEKFQKAFSGDKKPFEVQIIPAAVNNPANGPPAKLKTCAYCRVRTEDIAQGTYL
jgi:hypothetical protein